MDKENIKYESENGLSLLAQKHFAARDDMYEIVDFLNKTLKERGLMFGLAANRDEKARMTIKIYEV